jgi:PKD repeat protein
VPVLVIASARRSWRRGRALVLLALLLALRPPPLLLAQGGSSTSQNPTFIFTTPGRKTVTLTVCNAAGCSTVTKELEVLDPRPAIRSAQVAPTTLVAGQTLLLAGSATGRPPLAFTWRIARSGINVAILSGPNATWNTTGVSAGTYTATLTVQNSAGSAQSLPLPFTVVKDRAADFYTVVPCRLLDTRPGAALTAGVRRQIQVAGACGVPASAIAIAANVTVVGPTTDGHLTLFPGDIAPPGTSTLNFRTGRTRANNAVLPVAFDGSGSLAALASAAQPGASLHLLVDVSGYFAPNLLEILQFQAQGCVFGVCLFPTGQAITFAQQVSGVATTYRYDWDGNGTFEQSSPTPILKHAYPTPGFFRPRLQVQGPTGTATFVHSTFIGVQ